MSAGLAIGNAAALIDQLKAFGGFAQNVCFCRKLPIGRPSADDAEGVIPRIKRKAAEWSQNTTLDATLVPTIAS